MSSRGLRPPGPARTGILGLAFVGAEGDTRPGGRWPTRPGADIVTWVSRLGLRPDLAGTAGRRLAGRGRPRPPRPPCGTRRARTARSRRPDDVPVRTQRGG